MKWSPESKKVSYGVTFVNLEFCKCGGSAKALFISREGQSCLEKMLIQMGKNQGGNKGWHYVPATKRLIFLGHNNTTRV